MEGSPYARHCSDHCTVINPFYFPNISKWWAQLLCLNLQIRKLRKRDVK